MSVLESLHFLTEHRYPTVIEILLLLRKLERKGFDIFFSWVPGHVDILGNEQADNAARSMSDPMQQPVCYQDLKTSIQHYVHHIWQETWDQQILNKLHNIHPSTSHWAALPVRRHDVRLTRLRIRHTLFTHRHLLLDCPRVADVYVKWLTWLDDWEMHRDEPVPWRMVGLQPWKRALEKHVQRSHEKALANGMPSDVTLLEHI
ncbi:RNase H domain-containing protein [Trichonephila clavipes]|nr:RNase H domain-containing protein [Trichonephila clavipes]